MIVKVKAYSTLSTYALTRRNPNSSHQLKSFKNTLEIDKQAEKLTGYLSEGGKKQASETKRRQGSEKLKIGF